MLPSHTDLVYFMEVSRSLNISRAAERLGITQPSLSMSMKRLEDEVGTSLLIRSKTGVKLSKAGHRLARQSQALIQQWKDLKADVGKEENTISGTYSIGCHTSVALYSLPNFLAGIMLDYPELELQLSHDLSRKITEDVINFKLDFGIVINPVQHPDLIIKNICNDVVTLWTAPGNKNTDVLISDQNLMQTQDILKKLGKSSQAFGRTIMSPDLEVVAALTAAGCGCGILPTRVATRIKDSKLKKLPGKWPEFQDKVCFIYRADTQKTEASKNFATRITKDLTQKVPGN